MFRTHSIWALACFATLLLAAEPAWKKPVSSWTEEDARQILTHSPWVQTVVAGITPLRAEEARREGGSMGQPHGVGYDGLENDHPTLPPAMFGKEGSSQRKQLQEVPLLVRWASALPVRAAELKAHETEPPSLIGNEYAIAVYGVPGAYFGDPKRLGNPLKSGAALKRPGKSDLKPSSVEVFQLESGALVVYLFPLSPSIEKVDGVVEFTASIGRLRVSHYFHVEAMDFQGRLEL